MKANYFFKIALCDERPDDLNNTKEQLLPFGGVTDSEGSSHVS